MKIVPTETREAEADFNAEFCVHMLPKMEWEAVSYTHLTLPTKA